MNVEPPENNETALPTTGTHSTGELPEAHL
jgi:hypothetical protein